MFKVFSLSSGKDFELHLECMQHLANEWTPRICIKIFGMSMYNAPKLSERLANRSSVILHRTVDRKSLLQPSERIKSNNDTG